MKIGTMELVVIFIVIYLVLDPERTLQYAKKAGKMLRSVKIYISSMTEDIKESVVETLQELKEPLRNLAEPLNELTKSVQKPVDELNKTIH